MHPVLRNVIAVVLGIIVGSVVNFGIVMLSGQIIPPPPGVDVSNPESLKASMHLFEAKHFIFPFLAHALGTLAGAFLAALVARTHKYRMALIVGAFFLLGGIVNFFMIRSPLWFAAVDFIVAYLPMAWLGHRLTGKAS